MNEKKAAAALKEIACARCYVATAYTAVDKEAVGERVEWFHNKEAKFTVLRPMKERTGKEFCYMCNKIELKLCTASV